MSEDERKEKAIEKINAQWWVYMILCSDETYYTGITTDLDRRFKQHESGKGAKYFYGRKPVKFVFKEDGHDRSSASQREAAIKSLSRQQKIALLVS